MSIKTVIAAFSGDDKKKHFIAGFLIAAVISLFFGYLIGIAAAAVAAAGKEAYDKISGKGTPELLDFIATILGAVCFTAFSVVVSIAAEALITALL